MSEETQEIVSTATETPETETKPKNPRLNWKENFNVKEMTEIDKVDRLRIIAGVNEYKGQHLIFVSKVTDKDFSRQFFSMPAWVWEKTIPVIKQYIPKIAEIEKQAMAEAVAKELQRLKEMGIDIGEILKRVQ